MIFLILLSPRDICIPRLISQVPSTDDYVLKFAGRTMASKSLVLVRLRLADNRAVVNINCEKIVVGSMLAKELKAKLEKE